MTGPLAAQRELCHGTCMALFVLIGRDGEQGVALRKLHREAHLANLGRMSEAGRLTYAGPLRDEAGVPCGSVVIFQAPNLGEARAVADADPYTVNGVFQSVDVFETVQVFPQAP